MAKEPVKTDHGRAELPDPPHRLQGEVPDSQRWYVDHPEIIVVTAKKVACDGGGGALGHPKVWYDMAEDDWVECKYCDRIYALKAGSHDPHG